MIKQLTLLAYTCHDQTITLTLLALGAHENFYRDLKKSVLRRIALIIPGGAPELYFCPVSTTGHFRFP